MPYFRKLRVPASDCAEVGPTYCMGWKWWVVRPPRLNFRHRRRSLSLIFDIIGCVIDDVSSSDCALLAAEDIQLTKHSSLISHVSTWEGGGSVPPIFVNSRYLVEDVTHTLVLMLWPAEIQDGKHVDTHHCSASSRFRPRLLLLAS